MSPTISIMAAKTIIAPPIQAIEFSAFPNTSVADTVAAKISDMVSRDAVGAVSL